MSDSEVSCARQRARSSMISLSPSITEITPSKSLSLRVLVESTSWVGRPCFLLRDGKWSKNSALVPQVFSPTAEIMRSRVVLEFGIAIDGVEKTVSFFSFFRLNGRCLYLHYMMCLNCDNQFGGDL